MKFHRIFALFLCVCLLSGCSHASAPDKPSKETESASLPITVEPLTEPPPVLLSRHGHSESEISKYIVLWFDWKVETRDFSTAEVSVTVGLSCYSIDMKARPDMGVIRVNDRTASFSSPALKNDDNSTRHSYVFETRTFRLPMEAGALSLDIGVSWPFNGTYHGLAINDLTSSVSISFPEE